MSEWQPGDPLYQQPDGTLPQDQVVRPMFELLRDPVPRSEALLHDYFARCRDCDVWWHRTSAAACWICGRQP